MRAGGQIIERFAWASKLNQRTRILRQDVALRKSEIERLGKS